MPQLASLDAEECEILIHLLQSKSRDQHPDKNASVQLIDSACSEDVKNKLAKISEDENFAMKNTYKHQKETMKYADKKKMPVDSSKVRDLLRN